MSKFPWLNAAVGDRVLSWSRITLPIDMSVWTISQVNIMKQRYASVIPKNPCKNFPSWKKCLDFPRCNFSRFSPLLACVLRIWGLITGYNVHQENSSLYSISCQKSFAYTKTVCFRFFNQEESEPPCRYSLVTQNIWNDWLGAHIRYFEV